jgi:hypothetical protein
MTTRGLFPRGSAALAQRLLWDAFIATNRSYSGLSAHGKAQHPKIFNYPQARRPITLSFGRTDITPMPALFIFDASGSLGSTIIRLITASSCRMVPGLSSSNFSAISITFANERRSPFSALLRQTSATARILATLRTPSASFIRTFLKKASFSSPALFFLPLGRPFGFPD